MKNSEQIQIPVSVKGKGKKESRTSQLPTQGKGQKHGSPNNPSSKKGIDELIEEKRNRNVKTTQKKIFAIVTLFMISMLMDSCSVVGGIFKTGVGVGVFIVVLVVVIILVVVSRGKK